MAPYNLIQTRNEGFSASLLESATNGTGVFTCGTTADSPDLKLQIISGPSANKSVPADITVIEPSNAYLAEINGVYHNHGVCSVAMNLIGWYLPKNVSFSYLLLDESECAASPATGMFLDSRNYMGGVVDTNHYPGGAPGVAAPTIAAGTGNIDTGTPIWADPDPSNPDIVGFEIPYRDTGGTEIWPIPWNYSVAIPGHASTPFEQFTTATQNMRGNADGKASVSKKGVGPVSAALNAPSSSL